MADSDFTAWLDHLSSDEELLWCGRPDHKFAPGLVEIVVISILAIGFGVSAFQMLTVQPDDPEYLGIISATILSAAGMLLTLIGPVLIRRRTDYALSSRRAFIRIRWPIVGSKTRTWPINGYTKLHTVRPEPLSIYFAESSKITVNHLPLSYGFKRIKDGEAVLKLLQQIRDHAPHSYSYVAPTPNNIAL